jgi:hypothetical protein
MEYKGQYWITNARMVRYQSMLCENPQVKLEVVWTFNLVTLLPLAAGPPEHDSVEVINGDFSSHPDLCDQPLAQPDLQLFTDRSSFLKEGTRYGGYAVVTLDSILEGQTLVLGTSAQKAGLIDLTLALQPAVGRTVNIYTDCKDAFTSLMYMVLYTKKED